MIEGNDNRSDPIKSDSKEEKFIIPIANMIGKGVTKGIVYAYQMIEYVCVGVYGAIQKRGKK